MFEPRPVQESVPVRLGHGERLSIVLLAFIKLSPRIKQFGQLVHRPQKVRSLRNRLRDLGLSVNGLPFPVVSIPLPGSDAQGWWSQLQSAGIRAVLQQSRCKRGVMLTFLVRADHTPTDLDRLTVALRAIAVRRGAA